MVTKFLSKKSLGCLKQDKLFYIYLNAIEKILNVMKQSPKPRPLFQNNTPLRPTKACRVQERHQVDLVSMASVPATIDGDTYTCVMSVIDIFSRFVNLLLCKQKSLA